MGYLRSYWRVKTPSHPDGIANKDYVDDEIAAAIAALDLDGIVSGGMPSGVDLVTIDHNSSGTVTLDYGVGQAFQVNASANITGFVRANVPAGYSMVAVRVTNDHATNDITVTASGSGIVLDDGLVAPVTLAAGASLPITGYEWNPA